MSTNKADVSSIACCGFHCDDCPNHSGEIADLARDLRKKLREYHFEQVAPGLATFFKPFANYELCYETLRAMVKLRCMGAATMAGHRSARLGIVAESVTLMGAGNALILRLARSLVSSRRRTEMPT